MTLFAPQPVSPEDRADYDAAIVLLGQWRLDRPEVAIEVTRRMEEDQSWDGDGEHPGEEGYCAYIVTVSATRISDGRAHVGRSHLGGSWMKPDESVGTAGGYLPQMIDEAVAECDLP